MEKVTVSMSRVGTESIMRQTLDTIEEQVKDALIELGWTPPHHEPGDRLENLEQFIGHLNALASSCDVVTQCKYKNLEHRLNLDATKEIAEALRKAVKQISLLLLEAASLRSELSHCVLLSIKQANYLHEKLDVGATVYDDHDMASSILGTLKKELEEKS